VCPLATLLATDQVSLGDVLSINWTGNEPGLCFRRKQKEQSFQAAGRWWKQCKKPAVSHSTRSRRSSSHQLLQYCIEVNAREVGPNENGDYSRLHAFELRSGNDSIESEWS